METEMGANLVDTEGTNEWLLDRVTFEYGSDSEEYATLQRLIGALAAAQDTMDDLNRCVIREYERAERAEAEIEVWKTQDWGK